MKRLTFFVVMVLLFALPMAVESSEVKLSFNGSKSLKHNALSGENIHLVYILTTRGMDIVAKPDNILERGGEVVLKSSLALFLRQLPHEGEHSLAIKENGAENTSISFGNGINGGRVLYKGLLSNKERARVVSAGIDATNEVVDDSIDHALGKNISISEVLWIGANQGYASSYVYFNTSSPENCLGGCKDSFSDPEAWYGSLANSDIKIMNNLYEGVRRGAAWQSLGLAIPLYYGLKYLVTGEESALPNWWLNPQFDMTDAGVLYALGIWHKTEGGTVIRIRPGYGKNIIGKTMMALEVELSNISLSEKIKGGISGGFAKTKNNSSFVGASLERKLTDNFSLGVETAYYDGYNRKNPRAEGSWVDASVFIGISF